MNREYCEIPECKVIERNTWKTPASDYPDVESNDVRLKTTTYRGYYQNWGVNGYKYFYAENMPVKMLQIKEDRKWKTWMVDDPPHWWSMQNYAKQCKGNVLVAGLGLGLIVHALDKNPNVNEIWVVEQNQHVFDLILNFIPSKKIVCRTKDFYEFIEQTHTMFKSFDSVVFDLFVGELNKDFTTTDFIQTYLMLFKKYGDIPIFVHGYNNQLLREISIEEDRRMKESLDRHITGNHGVDIPSEVQYLDGTG